MQRKLLQLASVVMVLICTTGTSAKIVNTTYGRVDGNTITLDDGTTVNSWHGIPYAKPPIGDLRFEPPEPPTPWTAVFDAKHALPNACMQFYLPFYDIRANYSEDCLNLNVFAPQNLTNAPLAVMVWIHGGGYQFGANSQYLGHFLAARDTVIVVPNYRLGAFGFLSTPDGTVRGNMGLKDQRLALIWVRDNIANFGGDPSRVTIFGESAGAASVSLHLVSPLARGLFQQAMTSSGTELSIFALNVPSKQPEKNVYVTASLLNCTRPTDREVVTCLRTKTSMEILNANSITCPAEGCVSYLPIVDGPGGYLPKTPVELQSELDSTDSVPFVSGMTRDDGSFFAAYYNPELYFGGINREQFELRLRQLIKILGYGPSQVQIEMVFQWTRLNYVDLSNLDDSEANRQALVRVFTDFIVGTKWDKQLKTKSNKTSNVYGFVFAYASSNDSSGYPPWTGISHAYELPYIFGSPKLINNPDVRIDSRLLIDQIGWTADDVIFSDYVITLWTNFAKYGNPTPTPISGPFDNDSSITWSKFSTNDGLKVLYLDANARIITNYNQKNYTFISNFLPFVNSTLTPTQANCPPSGRKKKRNRPDNKSRSRGRTGIKRKRKQM